MNLKVIHIVFVSSAVLLALFFGGWCLAQGAEFFALGVGSFVVAAALVVYGFWFWRKITTPEEEWNRRRKLFRTVPAVVGLWLFGSEQAAWACSVCYGAAEGSMIDAARVGVWFLLGAVLVVQAAFVFFFLYLRRRARRFREDSQEDPVPPWWSTVEEPVKS